MNRQSKNIAIIDPDPILIEIDGASRALEVATSISEIKNVMVMAEAARIFARRVGASQHVINHAGKILLRSRRKMGKVIANTPKRSGGRGKLGGGRNRGSKKEPLLNEPPLLSEWGISKADSFIAQILATIPDEDFEKALSDAELNPSKVTQGFVRKAKENKRENRREQNRSMVAKTPSPRAAIKAGAKFATIVIDPPWDWGDEGDVDQMGRARPTYGTMSFDELKVLPVGELADVDCHIYLWITNRSLPKGFALLEAWGFRYVTCLTWCKPSIGMGNYFRGSTEQILFGVKGSQPLKRKDVGTWFAAPRGPKGHSSKPVESYSLVESCSPGPYIEMFARSNRAGWTAWGAESK